MKISAEQWAQCRSQWEGEPSCMLSDIAKLLEISRQSVHKHARKHGWTKSFDMQKIAERAYHLADQVGDKNIVMHPLPESMGDTSLLKKKTASPITEETPTLPTAAMREVAEDMAVGMRAKVLERHRREWDGARNLIYQAIKAVDFDKAKLAKITSEAIKIVQDGERKSWGLDAGGDDKPTRIVIERTKGVRIVQ